MATSETCQTALVRDQRDVLPLQESMFYADEEEDISVISPFQYQPQLFTHAPHGMERLTTLSNALVTTFRANTQYHKLLNVVLCLTLPRVQVLDKYRGRVEVAWCRNLAHNVLTSLEMSISREDDIAFTQTLDTFMLDIARQTSENIALYDEMIGNRSELLGWCNDLASSDLALPCPFSFTASERLSIPLHLLKAKGNVVSFRVDTVEDLTRLLRVRVRRDEDEPWVVLAWEPKRWETYLTYTGGLSWSMYGEYAMVPPEHIDAEQAADGDNTYTLYITDYIPLREKVVKRDTGQVNLVCPYPVRQVHFAFLDTRSHSTNDHSVYATTPLLSADISYTKGGTTTKRVPTTPGILWDLVSHYRYSRNKAPERGYYHHSFSYYPDSYQPDESANLDGARLTFKVRPPTVNKTPIPVSADLDDPIVRDIVDTLSSVPHKHWYTLRGFLRVFRALHYRNGEVVVD